MISDNNLYCDGRELPGFLKKSFMLPFAGAEIWFEHLDGIHEYSLLAEEKLDNDSDSILRPSYPSLVGIVLNETEITVRLTEKIVSLLKSSKKKFTKVAFIGANKKTIKLFKKQLIGCNVAVSYFEDFEKAKEWLVCEGL